MEVALNTSIAKPTTGKQKTNQIGLNQTFSVRRTFNSFARIIS